MAAANVGREKLGIARRSWGLPWASKTDQCHKPWSSMAGAGIVWASQGTPPLPTARLRRLAGAALAL